MYVAVQEVKDPGTSLVSESVDVLDESVDVLGAVSEVDVSQDTIVEDLLDRLSSLAEELGYAHDTATLTSCVSSGSIGLQHSDNLTIHDSLCSWRQYYPVISFLISGQLYAEYDRLSGLLGLPACSNSQWNRIVKKLEVHVTELAEWTCGQVQLDVKKRGDEKQWIASFDGFYLTRGHYSNNSSATLHNYASGKVAYFTHRTKRGPGHNWHGTSGGAESDMLEEVLGKVRKDGFVLQEMIADKDSSVNAIFCRHFPEGTLTYCSNHCAKTMHKNLETIKRNKCEVNIY